MPTQTNIEKLTGTVNSLKKLIPPKDLIGSLELLSTQITTMYPDATLRETLTMSRILIDAAGDAHDQIRNQTEA